MKIGLYRLHEILDDNTLESIETEYGISVSLISVYRAWNRCNIDDDYAWLKQFNNSSRDIMITWEPWAIPEINHSPIDQPDFSYTQILTGRYDTYIRAFAETIARFPVKVFLRPMHEMNGNWYPWCGTTNGNTPGDYNRTWRHIQAIVSEYAKNVHLVWSPYASSYPGDNSNSIEQYFPGDEFIDWVSLDGYNWGSSKEWSHWQSFEEIFSNAYIRVKDISRHPIMIGETACTETGGDKGKWIADASYTLQSLFTAVRLIVWFDTKKETDWRISSSSRSLSAFHLLAEAGV